MDISPMEKAAMRILWSAQRLLHLARTASASGGGYGARWLLRRELLILTKRIVRLWWASIRQKM